MTHGLDHSDADVVVEAGPGLYFRRLLDSRVEVVKYRVSEPNAGEAPDFKAVLEPEQWHQLIAAVGLGESPVVGEIKPAGDSSLAGKLERQGEAATSDQPSLSPAGAPS